MKIRYGLVLAIAALFAVGGCASGGGGGGGGTTIADLAAGAAQGEPPRNTENTRAASRAIDAAEKADDEAEARMHYEQALTSAQAAIAEDETNPLGHRLAAVAALGLEQYADAGRHFDRATALRPIYEFEDQPLRERVWLDLYQEASPLIQAGDYAAAAVVFENANAIYQGRPEAMFTLGQIYAQLGQHDKSIQYLDQAQAFMGSELMTVADSATAAGWREQAAEIPELRAQVLAAAGRYEEAADAYRALSSSDPMNLGYRRNLASILMRMERETEALQVYTDMLSRPGLTGEDYFAIGAGFYQASDYKGAARGFSGAANLNPRDRDALEMWARSLQLDESWADVPPVAQRWIALDPATQNGRLILAQAANQNGDAQTTQGAIQGVEGLQVAVDQLQLQRYGNGGALVSGSVINKKLQEGAGVTLRFTFYGAGDRPIGSVTQRVTVGAVDGTRSFQAEFDSTEQVGGYSYELTVG